ncbi:MAG: hypothetical protein WBD72_07890 [Candidatus Acidiferrum sp.]
MLRSVQYPNLSNALPRSFSSNGLSASPQSPTVRQEASAITALSIEFVAKPHESHKVHATLPAAINGALGEVAGFAGGFVMIANHETRLVTVVTLWRGEDRLQRCSENLRWVRALVAPYLDHCLRVQTLSAYVPGAPRVSTEFEQSCSETELEVGLNEQESMCAA